MSDLSIKRAQRILRERRAFGDLRGASDVAKDLLTAEKKPQQLIFDMVRALIASKDYELAERLLLESKSVDPVRWEALWLDLKWASKYEPDCMDDERAFAQRFQHLQWVDTRFLNQLIGASNLREALQFIGVIGLTKTPEHYLRLRLLLAVHLAFLPEVNRCLNLVLATDCTFYSEQEKLGIANQVTQAMLNVHAITHCFPILDEFLANCSLTSDPRLSMLKMKMAQHRGDWPSVRRILANYPELSASQLFLNARLWLEAQLGNVHGSKALFRARRHAFVYKALRPCRIGELIKVDNKPMQSAAEIRLLTVVKNERVRIPWFLDYYRALGVERFLFVDNASTDDTTELLLAQPDVHLFYTETKYSEGASGMVWINHLMSRFGRKGWNLYADVDEALVFPDSETNGLEYLTRYMERNHHEALPAMMLDMHARRGFSSPRSGMPIRNFSESYPFYHTNFLCSPSFIAPYYEVRGGGRKHLLKDRALQTKTPLIRAGNGILFLGSSHKVSPAIVSDVSAALLHFRMTDHFIGDLQRDLKERHRASYCDRRQQSYLGALSEPQAPVASASRAKFYGGSDSLLREGLIGAPSRYFSQIR